MAVDGEPKTKSPYQSLRSVTYYHLQASYVVLNMRFFITNDKPLNGILWGKRTSVYNAQSIINLVNRHPWPTVSRRFLEVIIT